MMITEHNCEDYFLLYIDDELAIAERRMVEDFLIQHPQYLVAFNDLRDTKLPVDNQVSFFNKEALYKEEAGEIGINNYEEYFLLYTDNELSDEQKETTERFVLQHPQLQEEFTLLQLTKLVPEIVEYKNKAELYRKERRRALPFYMTGLSAAAALFAILFLSGLFTSPPQHIGITASTSGKQANKPAIQQVQKQSSPADVANQPKENSAPQVLADKTISDKTERDKPARVREGSNDKSVTQITPSQQSPQEDVAIIITHKEPEVTEPVIPDNNKTAKQVTVLKLLDDEDIEPTNATTALSLSDNNMAQPAVYKELNTDDDNRTLYVSALRLNKNKVNGILKSASKLLGGRNRQTEQ